MKQEGYNLRQKQRKTIFECHNVEAQDLQHDDDSDRGWTKRRLRKTPKVMNGDFDFQKDSEPEDSQIYDSKVVLDKFPQSNAELNLMLTEVNKRLKIYKQLFIKEQHEITDRISYAPQNAVPICADVTTFNFDQLIKKQLQISQSYFDVIMMDPPWKLSTSQPSRGVAIQYDSLGDEYIQKIPINKLQKNGMLIIWAINAKYVFTVKLMEQWGYKIVDSITWVKKTINGKIAKGHGFYLQHAKETCLIGIKGDNPKIKKGVARDVIFSDRRGQSQKPEEIYEYVQEIVPNGYYLEIFGRRNNLRNNWVTIGNEI